jgi:hypothetical protein
MRSNHLPILKYNSGTVQLHGQSHRSRRRADVAYVVFVAEEGVNVSVEDEEDVVLLLLPQLLMVVVLLQLQP